MMSPVLFDVVDLGGTRSFSEIIPQSICTRYGLAIGANMAWFVRILIFALVRVKLCDDVLS